MGLLLALPHIAHADVAPPNKCDKVGASCDRAGPKYDQRGVCKVGTCSTANPGGGSRENPCNLCELEGGTAPATSSSGANSKSNGDAAPRSNSGCGGCEAGSTGANIGSALVASLGLVGALAYARVRDRRAARRRVSVPKPREDRVGSPKD